MLFKHICQKTAELTINRVCILSTMTLVLESIPELTRQPYFNVVRQIMLFYFVLI